MNRHVPAKELRWLIEKGEEIKVEHCSLGFMPKDKGAVHIENCTYKAKVSFFVKDKNGIKIKIKAGTCFNTRDGKVWYF